MEKDLRDLVRRLRKQASVETRLKEEMAKDGLGYGQGVAEGRAILCRDLANEIEGILTGHQSAER